MKKTLFGLLLFIFFVTSSCNYQDKIRVLILSGSNNHDWSATTPFLENMYSETGLFSVEITEKPDILKSDDLEKYDVIVSNWNSWPENDLRWNRELEKAILQFINKGGGFVFFHASTSAFYKWTEFREITCASWEENTGHGKRDTVEVFIENQDHPVTKGMKDFKLFDELWINARTNENLLVLGSATDKTQKIEGNSNQSAIFVNEVGKGHIFHTILGHDVEAMKSNGFKQLMLRGTEWAATGKVSIK
ncbi:MAG: ThuA domain-containing protein [Bacteroidetes bacterium]|nr:ThuA domain-containing protein [Bacteroidota bacterium]